MRDDPLDVGGFTDVVERLEGGLARQAPPDGLFDRILAEVQPAAREAAPADGGGTVVPFRPRRARTVAYAAGAAALAAAAAVAVTIGVSGDDLGDPDFSAAIAPAEGSPSEVVSGEAELYRPHSTDGLVRVELRDVPAPPSGHHYEVWVLREGSDAMESVGSFTPSGDSVDLELPLPGPGDYVAVDVSVEDDGGSAEHSDTSLATGSFS